MLGPKSDLGKSVPTYYEIFFYELTCASILREVLEIEAKANIFNISLRTGKMLLH